MRLHRNELPHFLPWEVGGQDGYPGFPQLRDGGNPLLRISAGTETDLLCLERSRPQQSPADVQHVVPGITAAGTAHRAAGTPDVQEKTKRSHCNLVQEKTE